MEEMVMMGTAYGKLLAKSQPHVIRTEDENRLALAELEALDRLGRPLSREEEELAELLTVLIQHFEETHYPLGKVAPHDAVRELMEARGLRQRDLIPVFGASSVVSDVLAGKRSISKAHAKKLAGFFHAPVSLFI